VNDKSKLILNPPPRAHKVKRGDCGTCQWFERVPEQPKNDEPWAGWCLHNQPIASQGFQQLGVAGPQGQNVRPVLQGVVPPTFETRRCAQWWPAGAQTPWDIIHGEKHGKSGTD
jgi:hypothetical protein